jgi:iron complex transport system substrate-binding protein
MLEALGLLGNVVACTRHCAALCPHLDISKLVLVEDSWTAQANQIREAKANVAIASLPYSPEALAEILKAGVRTLLLAPRTLEDIYGDIAAIASLMQVAQRGDQVIATMRTQLEDVRRQVRGAAKPRVYCEEWGKPILIAQPWVAELVEAAGGKFIGEPATRICADGVRVENPDAIIFGWCGTGDRVPVDKIIAEREWNDISAVRNGRVYVVRDDFLTTPAPTLIVGLHALAHAIHPELFPAAPQFNGKATMRRTCIPQTSTAVHAANNLAAK